MDLILLFTIAIGLIIALAIILFFRKKYEKPVEASPQRGVPVRVQQGIPLRAQIARNQRNRARTAAAEQPHSRPTPIQDVPSDDSDDGEERPTADFGSEKIGAKKRAKLEAKAEKKAQREAELQIREDKKKKEALAEEERHKTEELEKQAELKREEAEKLARELKEKQEYEEYLKMKAAFSIEEEGYDEGEDTNTDNALREFINHIKNNKVVVLEELARDFKLKTQAVIERIQDLKANGSITGVIDDRGKFIYISETELNAVAKFIRQRGRISIAELVESSNELINLLPVSVN